MDQRLILDSKLSYLNHFQLNLVITILRAATDCLHNGVDQLTRSFAVLGRGSLTLLILAVVLAITIQELVAEQFLNAVEKLLDKARQFGLDRHFKNEEVLVCAQIFFVLIPLDIAYININTT